MSMEAAIRYFEENIDRPYKQGTVNNEVSNIEAMEYALDEAEEQLRDISHLGTDKTYMLRAEVELLKQRMARAAGNYSTPMEDPLFKLDSRKNLDELRKRTPKLYTLEEVSLLYPLSISQLRKLRFENTSGFNTCCSTVGSKVIVNGEKLDEWIAGQQNTQ